MLAKGYKVVFEYTSEAEFLEGIRFIEIYCQKSFFETRYNDEIKKHQKVVAKGVSSEKAKKLVREVPLEKYYESLILSSYNPATKTIDVKKFSDLLEVVIHFRNGCHRRPLTGSIESKI